MTVLEGHWNKHRPLPSQSWIMRLLLMCTRYGERERKRERLKEKENEREKERKKERERERVCYVYNVTITLACQQELFCIGTELSLRALEELQHVLTESTSSEDTNNSPPSLPNQKASLMSLASKGAGRIPLDALVKFVRLARSYNQKEVVEMLAEHVIKIAKVWNTVHERERDVKRYSNFYTCSCVKMSTQGVVERHWRLS